MKKKILSVLLTVVLILSFGLAAPVAAAGPYVPVGSIPAVITVDVTEDSVIWTIDIDMALAPIGNGHIAYGLVVSLDQVRPAFQIHGNDGTDADFAWGTHLYSKWGPTIADGYNGWFTGGDTANNILVSSLGWVEATGERYIVPGRYDETGIPVDSTGNPDGIFTIAIDKAELGLEFSWAVQVMANTSDTHYPGAWVMWSGDASSFETVTIPGTAATATTEVLDNLIQISVDPTSLNFGQVYPGKSSLPQILSIQNTGSVDVNVEASSPSPFYTNNLQIDDGLLSGWLLPNLLSGDPIENGEIRGVKLQVVLPSDASPGIEVGTIIFWAEATR